MQKLNVAESVERMLDDAYEKSSVRKGGEDAVAAFMKHSYMLGYCEQSLKQFIREVIDEVGEEDTLKLMQRASIPPVFKES